MCLGKKLIRPYLFWVGLKSKDLYYPSRAGVEDEEFREQWSLRIVQLDVGQLTAWREDDRLGHVVVLVLPKQILNSTQARDEARSLPSPLQRAAFQPHFHRSVCASGLVRIQTCSCRRWRNRFCAASVQKG